jgi:glycosyltransferase involved in cell wall biosynthesis
VHFAFFGDGPCRAELESRIAAERITNVRLYGRQPREAMPGLQASFDAGLVPLAKGHTFENVVPSKQFEVMGSARPIVLCARGEPRRLLEGPAEGPAGVAVDPEDPAELARAVRRLVADRGLAAEMGRRGRQHVREHFDRAAIAKRVEAILLDTIARGRS